MLKVANAPCSWGVIENIEGDRYDYVRVLDELAATGYAGTELGDWGFMPTDPQKLRPELTKRNLAMLGSWVNVYLHDESKHEMSAEDCVRTGKLLAAAGGEDCLVILGNDPYKDPVRNLHAGRITSDMSMTEAQWAVFTKGAEYVAQRVKDETGLRCAIHHHIGTWIETPAETKRIMNMTNPDLVGLVFDTGHWSFGGGDPVSGVHQFAERIWHVHFKDHDPEIARQSRERGWDGPESVGKGIFPELGKGDVDFAGVLAALKAISYEGWIVVEQDVLPGMGTPKDSAQRNRDFIKSIGL